MSNDSGRNEKKRATSASPYSENFRVPMDLCQRHLINHRLVVSKLSRKELEDKYISLCDETFTIKKRFQEQEQTIKKLKTKLLRVSTESSKYRSKADISGNQSHIQSLETQRRELHEKLEALRKNDRKDYRGKRENYKQRHHNVRRPKEEQTTTMSASMSNDNDDALRYGDDRSVVDSSTEDDRTSSRSSHHKGSKSCRNCKILKGENATNEAELVKMKIDLKFSNKEMQNEKEKAALLERQLEEKLSYQIMRQNAAENLEIINLSRQLNDIQQKMQNQQEAEKRALEAELAKHSELEQKIKKEKDKNTNLFDECERLKKSIEKLKEHMSEVEIERDILKRQQDSYTKIVDENKLLRYQLEELRRQNQELTVQIETLQEEETFAKNAQKTMLDKLKILQADNDTLSVLLEGLRAENGVLVEEKTALEKNLSSLEDSPAKDMLSSPLQRFEISTQTDIVEKEDQVPVQTKLDNNQDAVYSKLTFLTTPTRKVTTVSSQVANNSDGELEQDQNRIYRKRVGRSHVWEMAHLLEQNVVNSNEKYNNAALLVSNATSSASTKLRKDFESIDVHSIPYIPARASIVTTHSSASSERRRISFQGATTELSSVTSDPRETAASNAVQQNYAHFFGHTPEQQARARTISKISARNIPKKQPTVALATAQTAEQMPSEYIAITIRLIRWQEKSLNKLISNRVKKIYVELAGFLDVRGHPLETRSVDILSSTQLELVFDYRIVLDLDESKHSKRRDLLRRTLRPTSEDVLKFLVLNESTDCTEIGYAGIQLNSEIQTSKDDDDSKTIDTPIYSITDPAEKIGTLQVVVEGINLLKLKFGS
ncbi:CAP-Gly domain-containing linker protein 1-like [Malaya genurostris]|uniref:CAP-Gly domain-containing linker protein 1-like n=1 Tax=Malaya genurostris TaxID=325434 RepID=UPI0026F3C79B|nr:CAP-Gly domain-containing linker protein 1-like [Malaya genurostris]